MIAPYCEAGKPSSRESGFGNAAALRAHFARRLLTTPTAYRRTFMGRVQ